MPKIAYNFLNIYQILNYYFFGYYIAYKKKNIIN